MASIRTCKIVVIGLLLIILLFVVHIYFEVQVDHGVSPIIQAHGYQRNNSYKNQQTQESVESQPGFDINTSKNVMKSKPEVNKSSNNKNIFVRGNVYENYKHQILQQYGTDNKGVLKPTKAPSSIISRTVPLAADGYAVPNIVHYVWLTKSRRMLLFTEMLSVMSVYKVQKPEVIYIHCNLQPTGLWWDELRRKVLTITLLDRHIPERIGRYKLEHIYHAIDITKLEILLQYGGIVLDFDVIVLNSLDPLRKYEMCMGKERAPRLSSAAVLANRKSRFLKQWYLRFVDEYRSSSVEYNCCSLPFILSKWHYDWIHIEETSLTTPDWMDRHMLSTVTDAKQIIHWRTFYIIHLMFQSRQEAIAYTPTSIKPLRNLIGKVLRLVYYGAEDELSDFVPWVYYSKHPNVLYGNVSTVKSI